MLPRYNRGVAFRFHLVERAKFRVVGNALEVIDIVVGHNSGRLYSLKHPRRRIGPVSEGFG